MLTRWYNIDRDFAVADELQRRFEEFFEKPFSSRPAVPLRRSWPKTNLYDAGTALIAELEVSGLKNEDIEIEAHTDALTVTGKRVIDYPEGYRVHRQERRSDKFSRSFGLPCKVDLEKTKAQLKNGLLRITLEKAVESQPKKITVSS